MKPKVLFLTPKTVFDVIYQVALQNYRSVPKGIFVMAVQQTAALHNAQFNPKHFNHIFNAMLYRYILVETDTGFYKPAHAS